MAKRKYRVISRNPTFDTPHGEIVELDNKREEAQALERGAIERVKKGEEDSSKSEEKKDDDRSE